MDSSLDRRLGQEVVTTGGTSIPLRQDLGSCSSHIRRHATMNSLRQRTNTMDNRSGHSRTSSRTSGQFGQRGLGNSSSHSRTSANGNGHFRVQSGQFYQRPSIARRKSNVARRRSTRRFNAEALLGLDARSTHSNACSVAPSVAPSVAHSVAHSNAGRPAGLDGRSTHLRQIQGRRASTRDPFKRRIGPEEMRRRASTRNLLVDLAEREKEEKKAEKKEKKEEKKEKKAEKKAARAEGGARRPSTFGGGLNRGASRRNLLGRAVSGRNLGLSRGLSARNLGRGETGRNLLGSAMQRDGGVRNLDDGRGNAHQRSLSMDCGQQQPPTSAPNFPRPGPTSAPNFPRPGMGGLETIKSGHMEDASIRLDFLNADTSFRRTPGLSRLGTIELVGFNYDDDDDDDDDNDAEQPSTPVPMTINENEGDEECDVSSECSMSFADEASWVGQYEKEKGSMLLETVGNLLGAGLRKIVAATPLGKRIARDNKEGDSPWQWIYEGLDAEVKKEDNGDDTFQSEKQATAETESDSNSKTDLSSHSTTDENSHQTTNDDSDLESVVPEGHDESEAAILEEHDESESSFAFGESLSTFAAETVVEEKPRESESNFSDEKSESMSILAEEASESISIVGDEGAHEEDEEEGAEIIPRPSQHSNTSGTGIPCASEHSQSSATFAEFENSANLEMSLMKLFGESMSNRHEQMHGSVVKERVIDQSPNLPRVSELGTGAQSVDSGFGVESVDSGCGAESVKSDKSPNLPRVSDLSNGGAESVKIEQLEEKSVEREASPNLPDANELSYGALSVKMEGLQEQLDLIPYGSDDFQQQQQQQQLEHKQLKVHKKPWNKVTPCKQHPCFTDPALMGNPDSEHFHPRAVKKRSKGCQTFMTVMERSLQPPVIGAILGIIVALLPGVRGIFVDLDTRTSKAPLQWFYNGLCTVGTMAIPINMMVLGCNLSASLQSRKAKLEQDDLTALGEERFSTATMLGIVVAKLIVLPAWGIIATAVLKEVMPVPEEIAASFYLVMMIVFLTPTANNVMVMVELSGSDTKEAIARSIGLQCAFSPLLLSITLTVAVGVATDWA